MASCSTSNARRPLLRRPARPPAATGRRSARDRSYRIASPRSGSGRCGNSNVSTPSAFNRRGGSRRRNRRCPARGPARCWPPSDRPAASAASFTSPSSFRRTHLRAHAAWRRCGRALAAGSIPEHRDAVGVEMLQQVAVVAGHLDHERVGPRPNRLGHRLGVAARVLHPARREGGEIGVVGVEDRVGRYDVVDLHQEAAAQTRACSGIALFAAYPVRRR